MLVMPHVNKNSPSPKPQMGGMMGSNTGVLSPEQNTNVTSQKRRTKKRTKTPPTTFS
jgi:hypothetical protein